MNRIMRFLALALVGVSSAAPLPASGAPAAAVRVRNPIDVARPSETISVSASDLRRWLQVDDIRLIQVRDPRSGQDLLTQAIDNDGDGAYDELIFQASLAPGETRAFELTTGKRRIPGIGDFKAHGRFVRERADDFAWENDRIAHRMYGKALETWAQEPLTSSAVDVWVKSVPRLVINDWYLVDDYHREHGEGGDFYNAGNTRGCGGNGIWANGTLYPSANFINSRVLTNGPIRVIFELTYPAWDARGVRVSEVKRITLDAGQNLDRFESHYTIDNPEADLQDAIGIRKGSDAAGSSSREAGFLRSWETLPDGHGQLGCAVIPVSQHPVSFTEDAKNFLAITKIENGLVTYYAGFGWTKGGFATIEAWDGYVSDYARRLRSPVEVKLSPQ